MGVGTALRSHGNIAHYFIVQELDLVAYPDSSYKGLGLREITWI